MQSVDNQMRVLSGIKTNPNFVPGTDEWLERRRIELAKGSKKQDV